MQIFFNVIVIFYNISTMIVEGEGGLELCREGSVIDC